MATIDRTKSHSLDDATAYERADTLLGKLQAKYGLQYDWQGQSKASFKGKGVSGSISLTPGNVALAIDLSLMLRPMKGQIEKAMNEQLEKNFPA